MVPLAPASPKASAKATVVARPLLRCLKSATALRNSWTWASPEKAWLPPIVAIWHEPKPVSRQTAAVEWNGQEERNLWKALHAALLGKANCQRYSVPGCNTSGELDAPRHAHARHRLLSLTLPPPAVSGPLSCVSTQCRMTVLPVIAYGVPA